MGQKVLSSPPSVTARQGVIWDEVGFRASPSGLKELCQTFTAWTEETWGSWLSCLCGHCAPSELVQEDCCGRVLNWSRLLMFYRANGIRSLVLLPQVIAAEAEHSAELLFSCPKLKGIQKKVLVEEVMATEAVELCRQDMSGTQSIIPLLALWVPTCICLDKLLSFCVSVYRTPDWPFKHHKINRQKYHTSLKKKITALPKSVWYLPWVCVLQQHTFPIPVSDNEQQYFWGVFAF